MRSAAAAQPRQFPRAAAVAAVLLGYAIHLGTLAHPFLLADNRRGLGPGPVRQGGAVSMFRCQGVHSEL